MTGKATQCSRKAVGSDCYCKTHIFGDKPPSTPSIPGWLSTSSIKITPDCTLGKIRLKLELSKDVIQRRIWFLTLTEYFLKNPSKATQSNIEICLDKMKDGPHLAYYREYFARKLSQRHRQEARQKYAESIIRDSDLGQDIAEVVARFVS